jgi:hypothetical protein
MTCPALAACALQHDGGARSSIAIPTISGPQLERWS